MDTELLLISFGNYLLKLHKVTFKDGNKEQAEVTHADLANWREAFMKATTKDLVPE